MKTEVMHKIAIISFIGVGAGVSAFLARHFLFKRRTYTDDEDNDNASVEVRLELPKKFVGYVIGKKGATIRKIREETGTSIKVRDADEHKALVLIRGLPEDVKAASLEIKKLAAESPCIFTKDVHIPGAAWLSVVGTNGDIVRYISHESKATLTVKWSPHEDSSRNHIAVRGTREQVDLALSMIDERIAESEVTQHSKPVGIAGRSLLENILPSMQQNSILQETLETDSGDKLLVYVQVFVSAIQTPNHFWLQKCGPKSVQLDKLISEMSDFYNDTPHRSSFMMQSTVPGDLVAAYYDGDRDWYRALVISVEKLTGGQMAATVFYVDFGDTAVVEFPMLCKLKPEYLVLPMQAIKCTLAGIVPIDERWSVEAIELFEKLTYLAQWKTIMAKPVIPSDCHSSSDNLSDVNDTKNSFLQVELFDTKESEYVSIGDMLVEAGFAVKLGEEKLLE